MKLGLESPNHFLGEWGVAEAVAAVAEVVSAVAVVAAGDPVVIKIV
jgi:hypothetical protein